ncbi:MAG: biotin--[acetyl-CoA-carboxylase] ligase, partial [Brachybacterium sp.]|nr:biotin--[acetyl-CoA-carboxylase] ligase [Brachybacterium sp.]
LGQVLGDTGARQNRIGLKWPNDLHTGDGRKLGGILVEARGPDLVLLGIGVNLRGPVLQADGRAVPGAAWLRGVDGVQPGGDEMTAVGREPDGALRESLESALATSLSTELARLESAEGDGVSAGTHGRYTMTCLTLGRAVRVDPLGETGTGGAHPPSLYGTARAIDAHGRLVVDLAGGARTAVDIGDVRHLRPDGPARPTTQDAMGIEQEEHGT